MNRSAAHPNGHVIELPPYYRILKQNSSSPAASPVMTAAASPVMTAAASPVMTAAASSVLTPLSPSVLPPTILLIAPGKGFGDGRHETTQLCLLAMGYLLRSRLKPLRVLDFGAGNGILGIAAAKAGATVEAVEIDDGALAEAKRNAELNGVVAQFEFRKAMRKEGERAFDLVVANILRAILLDYASDLSLRVSRGGYLVLSGLTSTDVPFILAGYRPLLPEHRAEVYERGQWRAVVFSPAT